MNMREERIIKLEDDLLIQECDEILRRTNVPIKKREQFYELFKRFRKYKNELKPITHP